MPELAQWVQIAPIVGAAVALFGLFKGLIEYSRQAALKRAEHFFHLRGILKQNETFKEICNLLENDDPRIAEIDFKEKRNFLGLFEEVALAMNSNLINYNFAFYMFGYYAILCWENDNFWINVNRESCYWMLFRDFAEKMKSMQESVLAGRVDFNPKQYRF